MYKKYCSNSNFCLLVLCVCVCELFLVLACCGESNVTSRNSQWEGANCYTAAVRSSESGFSDFCQGELYAVQLWGGEGLANEKHNSIIRTSDISLFSSILFIWI